MAISLEGKLVIAISSRALFDLDESNKVFEQEGEAAYTEYQIQHENEMLSARNCFSFDQASVRAAAPGNRRGLGRNYLDFLRTVNTGLRVFNAVKGIRTGNYPRCFYARRDPV